MTQKLNQIVAIEKSIKSQTETELTAAYHLIQKAEPLKGIARSYQKKNDDGDDLPPESTRVQINAGDVIKDVAKTLTRLFDVTATKDWANTQAKADVVVDGSPLLKDVPISHLLFLEKKMTDIHTFVKKLPLLDPADTWEFDSQQNAYRSQSVRTTRTKKAFRNHVKAPATDKHPAQVDVFSEDEIIGYWTTSKFSGALPAKLVATYLERVEKLQRAVKFAIEAANVIKAENQSVGSEIFGYLFKE